MGERTTTAFKPPSAQDPLVREIVRRLVDFFQPERIYLFGSAARGDADSDSDYDFMVIVSDDNPDEVRKSKESYKALRGIHGAVDVVVWTRKEFDKRLHLKASFPSTIVREGVLLYGTGPGTTR